ncbi:hypothetical protein AVEN_188904-1 [Araneus ventricosus]|uniref:Uncharacterized protein n=1 Tax=Araneus ventricosus TaxID=182803 RepID=A0A4Y2P5Y8_ARAVE|nr:hypothetical protein AVEN_188904-1 [Araneus ventricosus]
MFTGVGEEDVITERRNSLFMHVYMFTGVGEGPANRKKNGSCMFTGRVRNSMLTERMIHACLHVCTESEEGYTNRREWFMHVYLFTGVGGEDVLTAEKWFIHVYRFWRRGPANRRRMVHACLHVYWSQRRGYANREWFMHAYMFTGVGENC